MKVTDKAGAGVSNVTGGAVKRTSLDKDLAKLKGATAESTGSAKVDVSERAQDIKKSIELASKGINDVDEEKVAKFQRLIDSGQYKVDARKIADKMVDEHLSMSGSDND
jgi:negative regulator of flagellin synthesis FlgM